MCEGKFVPTNPCRYEKMFLRGKVVTGKCRARKTSLLRNVRGGNVARKHVVPPDERVATLCTRCVCVCVCISGLGGAYGPYRTVYKKTNIITRYWNWASRFTSFERTAVRPLFTKSLGFFRAFFHRPIPAYGDRYNCSATRPEHCKLTCTEGVLRRVATANRLLPWEVLSTIVFAGSSGNE